MEPTGKNLKKESRIESNKFCSVQLEKFSLEEYIPLSKFKQYLKWKKMFRMQEFTVKLQRVKLLCNGEKIRVLNATVKI